MRLALHFEEAMMNSDGRSYLTLVSRLFEEVLRLPKPAVTSQMFIGSLLLHYHAFEVAEVRDDGHTEEFNRESFLALFERWSNPPSALFCTFDKRTVQSAIEDKLFVISLTHVSRRQAELIDAAFKPLAEYRGAVEVDPSYGAHALLYAHSLCAFGRIHGRDFSLFWDGFNEDEKDNGVLAELRKCGFDSVSFEALNGRYSIFDARHTPEQTLMFGETRKMCQGLLGEASERVLDSLTDVAPALPEKLNGALKAINAATTTEQIAQAALSCRRIIEYVADRLFPPLTNAAERSGEKLDKQAYRNRLRAYADKARASDTSIELIVASRETLTEQWKRLDAAINKGIHGDLLDAEGRRCVIRTILLLDDLISLKAGPFEMKPDLQPLKYPSTSS